MSTEPFRKLWRVQTQGRSALEMTILSHDAAHRAMREMKKELGSGYRYERTKTTQDQDGLCGEIRAYPLDVNPQNSAPSH